MNPEKPRKTTYFKQPAAVSPAVNQHMRTITDEAGATVEDFAYCFGYLKNPLWWAGLVDIDEIKRRRGQDRQAVELAQPGNLARAA